LEKAKKIKELFTEADELAKKDEFSEAEKKLIEIIGLDSRNMDAFNTLGDIYAEMKNYQEAIQTYEHTLRLIDPEMLVKIAEINYSIALAAKSIDDHVASMRSIERALEIEPNNPRYLDFVLNFLTSGIYNPITVIAEGDVISDED